VTKYKTMTMSMGFLSVYFHVMYTRSCFMTAKIGPEFTLFSFHFVLLCITYLAINTASV